MDLMTISEAYSQDVDTRPIRRNASVDIPRIPQWMSVKWLGKMMFSIQVVAGVPKQRCKAGMAPGSIVPRNREPITNSAPSRKASTKAWISLKS
jgi:hypothetical protein